jgi:ABC-type bacteriocin/lantibiotic exporter with double-glycine peptidase domain
VTNKRAFNTRIGEVVAGVRNGLALMTARERKRTLYLLASSMFFAFLQTAALISIIPIIQMMVDPSKIPMGRLQEWAGPAVAELDSKSLLLILAGGVVALIVIKGAFNWLHLGWISRFSADCEVRLMSLLMRQLLTTHYAWLVQQNSSRLRELIFGFVTTWSRQFIRSFMRLLNDLLFAAIIVVVLIWAEPTSGLIVGVVVSLFAGAAFFVVRPELLRLASVKRSSVLKANSISLEAILGIKEVKMAGIEDRFSSLFNEQIETYAYADAKGQQWVQLPRILLEFVAYGSLVGISIFVVVGEVQSAELGGLLLLYGLAALRLMPIFSTVVSNLATLLSSFPILDDLDKLIGATQATELAPTDSQLSGAWAKIRLDNVSLRYAEAEQAAVQNVSLSIEPSRSYGVVGPSGAGKSTAIDLIAGLLEPSDGAVSVDGQVLEVESRRAWRRRFGYVSQRPFLLDASMRENIVFDAFSNVDEKRLAKAVSLARLEQVVARLPKGLSSRLGEQGNLLSGGERQRVAIARALYRGADILILDEATSSLDTLVEREIAESIENLRGLITTIIVSHRLGLVRDCDEIWLFDKGRLEARGRHQLLLETSDLYRRMVN